MNTSPIDAKRISAETFVAVVEHHATLGSTNDRALQAAAEGEGPLPMLFLADRQTAGRGRGRNRWWTGPGALAMSLLLDSGKLAGESGTPNPLVSLAVAVALTETVAPCLGEHPIAIRWPNDVLVDGAKLAGILIEATAGGKLIIGIGLNTNNTMSDAPAELLQPATTLRDLTGREHDHTDLLVRLLSCLESSLDQTASRPEDIAARADSLCFQRDKRLTLKQGTRTTSGHCLGISPDGALLIETPTGRQKFYSGVVQ